ncbi:ERV41 like membrane associated protein involved in vesicular transport [Cryptosporidium ryanae]|uniref:ERV41 like membrane associated protein involved in vesicular transport n=1 Tax=Cryptosporidium ryanae TaxID=515981 RepID=UPI00351A65DD|nr:ERV41 like membrane associated protein involved in vesicular transport [Cryptosporidium ryanae]
MRQFDAFSKPISELRVKTAFGGYLTILSTIIIVILFYSELRYYLNISRKDEVTVDKVLQDENISLKIQLEFPKIPCDIVGVRLFNTQENSEIYLPDGSIEYSRIGAKVLKVDDKMSCGSCYDASNMNVSGSNNCCNSCRDVFNAFDEKGLKPPFRIQFKQCDYNRSERLKEIISSNMNNEGCIVKLDGHIPKVKGKIEVSHKRWMKYREMTDLEMNESHLYDFSYKINYLIFGEDFPNIPNNWKNQKFVQTTKFEKSERTSELIFNNAFIDFDMHCIPTQYHSINNKTIKTYQFSVRSQYKRVHVSSNGRFTPETSIPGLHINYDFTPFLVKITEYRKSFLSFISGCCAIIGGIFAFSGMIDIFFYKLVSHVNKSKTSKKNTVIQSY